MAIGALQSAHTLGVRVPQDLAIIGCGNLHYDESLRVPLSSMDQKSHSIGEKTAQLILDRTVRDKYEDTSDHSTISYLNLNICPKLVIRESSRRK